MIDTILYSLIIILSNYILLDYNFFLKITSIDSLFSAIHFIKIFISRNLTDSQIISKSNALYLASLLDRYIYYIILYCICKLIGNFIWLNDNYYLYSICTFSVIPNIINYISTTQFFQKMREKKEYLIKMIISKIFVSIIKFYSKIYLQKEVIIKNKEIFCLLNDYKETIKYFHEVLKNLLIILILSYVKDYSPKLYYNIIKHVYNYKMGDVLVSFNNKNSKQYLLDIIENKKWSELNKPMTYKAVIHIYQYNNDKSDMFKRFITEFNFSLIKMFTVWTIASLLDKFYVIPILSFIMLIYRSYKTGYKKFNFVSEIGILIFASLIGFFLTNYYIIDKIFQFGLVSALCQFGLKLFFNKVTFILIKILTKNTHKKAEKIFVNNKNISLSFLVTLVYAITLRFMNISEHYLIIGLNILTNILMSIEIKKQIMFGTIIASTYLSNFNTYHIIFNSLTLYIFLGLVDNYDLTMFQDQIKVITEEGIMKIEFPKYFSQLDSIYCYIKSITRKSFRKVICFVFRRERVQMQGSKTLIFDLMNTDKYPSMSDGSKIKLPKLMKKDNQFTTQKIVKRISSTDPLPMEGLDTNIFNLPDREFIDAISIENKVKIIFHTRKPETNFNVVADFVSN
jgi:hypothetical protein